MLKDLLASISQTSNTLDSQREQVDNLVLEMINADIFHPDESSPELSQALVRLRRRGLIENVGGRKYPRWVIVR